MENKIEKILKRLEENGYLLTEYGSPSKVNEATQAIRKLIIGKIEGMKNRLPLELQNCSMEIYRKE